MKRMRGFTLVEVVMVVAIIALIMALAVPMMRRTQVDVDGEGRRLYGNVLKIRQLAMSGRGHPAWNPDDRAVNAGLIFNPTGYQLFLDVDQTPNGNEATVEVVDYTDFSTDANSGVRVVEVCTIGGGCFAPLNTEVRFRRNGTLSTPQDREIVIADAQHNNQRSRVRVHFGGAVRVMSGIE